MGVKILLADDSSTVLKVIKILLKDEAFEIVECLAESELMSKVDKHTPQLVFLDFNFSETKTGYDLARDIKSRSPSSKVLMMYGTFDTPDESALKQADADQFVVKPFDTSRFLIQVKSLLEGGSAWQAPKVEPKEPEWNIRETVERKLPDVERVAPEAATLDDDLSEWGMKVPGVIGRSSGSADFPPVIDMSKASTPQIVSGPTLPSQDDLEYPTLDVEGHAPQSRLVSLNELNPTEEDRGSDRLLELSGLEDDGVKRIEEQIQDEVQDNLWSVDVFEESKPQLSVVKETKTENENFFSKDLFSDSLFENEEKPRVYAEKSMDIDSLRPLIKELVQEAVKDYCRQQVDKVAWDIIPDLAENLIRQELQKLSDRASRDI